MAKNLQLLRNQTVFDSKSAAIRGLKAKLITLLPGEPAIASYTDNDKKSILLGIALDATNYQIFEGAKVGEDGNLEIPEEVLNEIKNQINVILGGASDEYNTLKKIEDIVKGVKTELDKTQASAGLSEDGSYVAETGSNYIDGATSLKDADKKLDAAIKAVEANATKVAAGNGIDVQNDETGHTATISVKLNSNDKVLSVDGQGLLANINLTWSSSDGLKLIGKEGTVIASIQATDFIKDGMLENVELVKDPEEQPQGTYLKFTFNTDAGSKVLHVNVTSLIDVYVGSNGINVSGKSITAVKDPTSEEFLEIGVDGIKVSGVQDAIDAAKTTVGAYTVNSKAINTNPVLNGGDIKLNGFAVATGTTSELNVAPTDTVNIALGKHEKAIIDNEEVCSKAFDTVKTSVGLGENLEYVAASGTYISGATSVQDADAKLDSAIKAVSDKVDSEIRKECLVQINAGNGITVTPKAASQQTISANVKSDDPILEVTSEGIKTKDNAEWDCGEY